MSKMIVIITGVLLAAVAAPSADTTICDLQGRKTPPTGVVAIEGRLGFTSHGIFLLSDGCRGKSEDAVILFPGAAGAPAVGFSVDDRAVSMLKKYMRPNGGTARACAVFRGEVFRKKRLKAHSEGGGPQGNGFGPRGAFSLAIVIESVRDIQDCK